MCAGGYSYWLGKGVTVIRATVVTLSRHTSLYAKLAVHTSFYQYGTSTRCTSLQGLPFPYAAESTDYDQLMMIVVKTQPQDQLELYRHIKFMGLLVQWVT